MSFNWIHTPNLSHIDHVEIKRAFDKLRPKTENIFEENVWNVSGYSVRFNIIEKLQHTHKNWYESFQTDPVFLAKIIFLTTTESRLSSVTTKGCIQSILKTFIFMAERSIHAIKMNHLEEYISFLLMNSIYDDKISHRLTPLAYGTLRGMIQPFEWFEILQYHNLPSEGFDTFISQNTYTKSLEISWNNLSGGEISFRDWIDGGSFNHLTLDYGRYYIEHASDFFDSNIDLAIALKLTIKDIPEIITKSGLSSKEDGIRKFYLPMVGQFLSGVTVDGLTRSYREKLQRHWLEAVQKNTLIHFENHLRKSKIKLAFLSFLELKSIAEVVGLDIQNDMESDIASLLVNIACNDIDELRHADIKTGLEEAEKREFIKIHGNAFDISKITEYILANMHRISSELKIDFPTRAFFKSIGIINKNSCSQYLNNFFRSVGNAGMIKVVALTGWRESEFGFSMDNIAIDANFDLLDQYSDPLRYWIDWIVPKSNGSTRLHREITRPIFQAIQKLSIFHQACNDEPCLYSYKSSALDVHTSGPFINHGITGLWINFVDYYKPFEYFRLKAELKLLSETDSKAKRSRTRMAEISELLNDGKWIRFEKDKNLNQAYERTVNERSRVKFFLEIHDKKTTVVDAYRAGTLEPKTLEFLNQHVSTELRNKILELDAGNYSTTILTRAIVSEVMADCLYPTSHALRHMWAEAVYRRFDGDVGWMIRSNFKHISQNMWLAYIRGKSFSNLNKQVKATVASSLLTNYLKNEGNGYSGAMENLLRRLFLRTKTVTVDELQQSISQFAIVEIEDIKSNPWGYCLLKKRNKTSAKCAKDGIPQRHNASASLCLGCTNNLSQTGNVEGILLATSNHLKVLQTDNVPKTFKIAAYKAVKYAVSNLKKLKVDKSYIEQMESALSNCREI